jgi:hypothetical protein
MSTAHSFLHLLLCGLGPLDEDVMTAAGFYAVREARASAV